MDKKPYSDNKFYNFSADKYADGKDDYKYESVPVYSIPCIGNYSYEIYEKYFSFAESDTSFVWFSSQRQKLNESEFNQIKVSIQELRNNKNPSQSEINGKIAFLENQILLNQYQYFTYKEYLHACDILKEVGGSQHNTIVYNPPLDEKKFLSEKQRILKSMVEKDNFSPFYVIGGNTIFPNCFL